LPGGSSDESATATAAAVLEVRWLDPQDEFVAVAQKPKAADVQSLKDKAHLRSLLEQFNREENVNAKA
jgi:hypothetical protein